MKTSHKGFIAPLLLILVAILLLGGGAYAFIQNRQVDQSEVTSTSDWKTYTNATYGFESKYPESYSVFYTSGDSNISFRSTEGCKALKSGGGEWPADCQAYDIIVQKNKVTGGIESFKTVVAGIQAEKIATSGGMWDDMTQVIVQFQKDQNWYIQTFTFSQNKSQEAEGVMNQILATFKFTP